MRGSKSVTGGIVNHEKRLITFNLEDTISQKQRITRTEDLNYYIAWLESLGDADAWKLAQTLSQKNAKMNMLKAQIRQNKDLAATERFWIKRIPQKTVDTCMANYAVHDR